MIELLQFQVGIFTMKTFYSLKSMPGTQPEKCHFDILMLVFLQAD